MTFYGCYSSRAWRSGCSGAQRQAGKDGGSISNSLQGQFFSQLSPFSFLLVCDFVYVYTTRFAHRLRSIHFPVFQLHCSNPFIVGKYVGG
jgi:hypothetical protein